MSVHELPLDLDAFEGPFDLLLTLVLREELEPRDVDVADVIVAFLERMALRAGTAGAVSDGGPGAVASSGERAELDLDACGEFLVLVAALLELKARELFPDEEVELADLDPEAAAEELARRLEEYRRLKEAAQWLVERLDRERDRYFRLGPPPLPPLDRSQPRFPPQHPEALAAALRALAAEPPDVSLAHMALRFPPVSQFLERFRALLRRRPRFDFEQEVTGLSRVEQAVAFLALLELRKAGEIRIDQAGPFARIRIAREEPGRVARAPVAPVEAREGVSVANEEGDSSWNARSA